MGSTCTTPTKQQLIAELGRLFDQAENVAGLLAAAEVPTGRLKPFATMSPEEYWRYVWTELEKGLIEDGVHQLLSAAANIYQGNLLLRQYISDHRTAQESDDGQQAVVVRIPGNLSTERIHELIGVCRAQGVRIGELDFTMADGQELHFNAPGTTPERARDIGRALVEALREAGVDASAELEDHHFLDYFFDALFVEGPDQQRFILDRLRASTRVRDVIQGIMDNYDERFFPADKTGAPRRAVIDRVQDDGCGRRLHPDDTLHDAGVRPHDTLRVSPEARAGAVNPIRQREALVAVKNQILDFCASSDAGAVEFTADANDDLWPTEYLFHFRTPSVAPSTPDAPRSGPQPITGAGMAHDVLLQLPRDFPVQAPCAYWQTPIFHPNVVSTEARGQERGLVCMGDLQESYRPGLNFAALCRMLVDIARYRNYVIHEGYNTKAADWANSDAGQAVIVAMGGRSKAQIYGYGMDASRKPRPVRVRRLES